MQKFSLTNTSTFIYFILLNSVTVGGDEDQNLQPAGFLNLVGISYVSLMRALSLVMVLLAQDNTNAKTCVHISETTIRMLEI